MIIQYKYGYNKLGNCRLEDYMGSFFIGPYVQFWQPTWLVGKDDIYTGICNSERESTKTNYSLNCCEIL